MMRTLVVWFVIVLLAGVSTAGESVAVPWEEIKALYRKSVERDLMARLPKPEKPAVYTLEEAVYDLKLDVTRVEGRVLISGRVFSGTPEPIPLFAGEMIITGVPTIQGGTLLSRPSRTRHLCFLPAGKEPFQVALTFLLPVQEDSQSRIVSFKVPPAIRNALRLSPAANLRVVDASGVADAEGRYHFAAAQTLTVRFEEKERLQQAAPLELDMLSRLRLQGARLVVTTFLEPVRPVRAPFVMQLPDQAQYVSSSLKGSWIQKTDAQTYKIRLPAESRGAFHVQWTVPVPDRHVALALPVVRGNTGRQGALVLEEPDDGQIEASGKGLVARLPISRLRLALRQSVCGESHYLRLPPGEELHLAIQRFAAVGTTTIVLDAVSLFVSVEENGGVMSVLRFAVPQDVGSRLDLPRVSGAQIWSLRVNGKARKVYTRKDATWVIPLARGQASLVELAFLRQGPKLGLQGRLQAQLPALGLPARQVTVGVALPDRVELLSLEGAVSPTTHRPGSVPKEFLGHACFFSRTFYKGDALPMTLYYKEPVDETLAQKGD